MATRDIVVIGASAGGIEALTELVERLPRELPASLFVVQHIPANHKSLLPRILAAAGPLPVSHPADGEEFVRGHIYVAPADHHLLLEGAQMRVVRGPRENGHRPAADALFRTAARSHGPRVIGVVLTGALDDGAAGLISVKQYGGFAVVQDPQDAWCADMPRQAMERVQVDAVVTVRELARKLSRWTRQRAAGAPRLLPPSAAELEAALWCALRVLGEQMELTRRLADRARKLKYFSSAGRYDERTADAERQVETLRRALRLAAPKQR
jgi:two-component system chemotaxis response regulator CheB